MGDAVVGLHQVVVGAAGEKGAQFELERAGGALQLVGDGEGVCAVEQGEAFDNLSFRELKRWAKKTALYGDINEAFVDAIYTNLEAGDQILAEALFETVFSTELELTDEYSTSAGDMLDKFVGQSQSAAA